MRTGRVHPDEDHFSNARLAPEKIQSEYAYLEVEDEGCGLPDDVDEKLFQPFFTTKDAGMGMGLSISRTIAATHDGRLWFERKPHGGVRRYFRQY